MINVEAIYKMREQRQQRAGQADDFQRMFEQWGQRHPIHSHPYLDYIFDPQNNDLGAIKRFVEALYAFCERFHDCLFELGAHTQDEEVRRAIAANLHDEYGAGNKAKGHLHLMRRLLHSLGYSDAEIRRIRLNSGAENFMTELLRYCREESALKAIGCICIGAECNGATYFRKIYQAFRAKECLKGASLTILAIHAGDDVEHRASMLALIEPYLSAPETRRLIEEGFLDSIHLFQQLWTSMAFYEGQTQTALSQAA